MQITQKNNIPAVDLIATASPVQKPRGLFSRLFESARLDVPASGLDRQQASSSNRTLAAPDEKVEAPETSDMGAPVQSDPSGANDQGAPAANQSLVSPSPTEPSRTDAQNDGLPAVRGGGDSPAAKSDVSDRAARPEVAADRRNEPAAEPEKKGGRIDVLVRLPDAIIEKVGVSDAREKKAKETNRKLQLEDGVDVGIKSQASDAGSLPVAPSSPALPPAMVAISGGSGAREPLTSQESEISAADFARAGPSIGGALSDALVVEVPSSKERAFPSHNLGDGRLKSDALLTDNDIVLSQKAFSVDIRAGERSAGSDAQKASAFMDHLNASLDLARNLSVAAPDGGIDLPINGTPLLAVNSMPAVSRSVSTISEPVSSASWGNVLAEQTADHFGNLDRRAGLTGDSIEMQVNPPDLGPLRIAITLNNGVATAAFQSHSQVVRLAIEQAMPLLEHSLAERGLTLGQASVADQGANRGQEERSASNPFSPIGPVIQSDAAPVASLSAELSPVESRAHGGVISTFA